MKKNIKNMLLAVDIGNTTIHLGIFKDRLLLGNWRILTKVNKTNVAYQTLLKNLFKNTKVDIKNIKDTLICSVVPSTCNTLAESIKCLIKTRPLVIGRDLTVPIKNLYRNPKQVGSDRLVNAFVASKIYGAPIIIVDFGTAVTFDVVSKNNEYLGGFILPGLDISLEALAERTALLPKIELSRPKEFIGRDTKNSMLSGIVYGFGLLTDSLIIKIKDRIGKDALVIGTGGNIELMTKYCKRINRIDSYLTLKGLNLIYKNKKEILQKNT